MKREKIFSQLQLDVHKIYKTAAKDMGMSSYFTGISTEFKVVEAYNLTLLF